MAVKAKVFYDMKDKQGRTFTFEFNVTPPADWGTGVDLPTLAHIKGVWNSIVLATIDAGLSVADLDAYGVKVYDNDDAGFNPGDGAIAINNYIAFSSGVGEFGHFSEKFGFLGIENKIPSARQDTVTFNNKDRNTISTIGTLWTNLRTALVAIGFTDEAGNSYTVDNIAESAIFFTGKRSPMKPR